ncbi:MAG: radical SAM protein [Ruminococcaceae bacterium]|nr:radical SAM protein [Oscillospiraceae bacterium]
MDSNEKKYYLAEIHMFEKEGTFFVFLPCNLQLFEVDGDTYKKLKKMSDTFGTQIPIDVIDDDFLEAGIIYESDKPQWDVIKSHYELSQKVNQEEQTNPPITNTVLQIANDCNLNCIYCYGDGGSYGRKRELMTLETAKKAIDLMVANSEGLEELLVIFFGGEPLINFDVVKGAFDYCKSLEQDIGKKFHFSMTTNGTILNDEIYRFIKDNKISVSRN